MPVGEELAERLGAEFLDREIVAQVAVRAGIPENEARELRRAAAQRSGSASPPRSPRAHPKLRCPTRFTDEQLPDLTMQERLVRSDAQRSSRRPRTRGNAVIVGRGGAFILGKRPDVLHVQLHASMDARIRYLMSRVEEIPEEARPDETSLRDTVHGRSTPRGPSTSSRLFGVDWLDARDYDLAVDTGTACGRRRRRSP